MARRLDTIEKEKAKLGLANGESLNSIGRRLKRSPSTIMLFANKPETIEAVNEQRENLANKFSVMSERLLDSVDEITLSKMSGYQRIIGSAASADKSLALRGIGSEKMRPVINIIIGDPRTSVQINEGSTTHECTYEEVNGKLDD